MQSIFHISLQLALLLTRATPIISQELFGKLNSCVCTVTLISVPVDPMIDSNPFDLVRLYCRKVARQSDFV